MQNQGFIEEHPYTLGELAVQFDLADNFPQAKELLQRLVLSGVAKLYSENTDCNSQDDALRGEFAAVDFRRETRFKFAFVGILEVEGHVIKCFPKFLKNRPPQIEDMRLVLHAIERYNAEHTGLDMAYVNGGSTAPNPLALALRLLRDYFTYGLYANQKTELVLQGQGEIDWDTTINTTMPMIRDNRPYYFDYYTNDVQQDENDYFTRLHSCIITECSRRLHKCEIDSILQLETPTPYSGERRDFGTDDFICQRLQKELNVQFVSRKQETLRNIQEWIQNTPNGTNASEIQLFGTNNFHVVWEAMCADVFDSQYKHKLSALGMVLKGDFANSNDTLETLIKKPIWKATGCREHKAKTLRPDFVSVITEEGHSHFVILDAKYYDIELDDKKVKGQPGVEDVSKQYLYQVAYADFIKTHSLKPLNAFLSPTDSLHSHLLGEATMPIFGYFKDPELHSIHVVKLAASKVMEHYVNHTHLYLWKEVPELFTIKVNRPL